MVPSARSPSSPSALLVAAALGAATFALLHLVFTLAWERWFLPAQLEVPWFLGARRSLVTTQVTFAAVALVYGVARRGGWRQRLRGAGALAAGAVATMTALFTLIGADRLLLGPPRLWPVALFAGAIVLALPVLAGTLAAGILRRPR